jgi:hypothetical protein
MEAQTLADPRVGWRRGGLPVTRLPAVLALTLCTRGEQLVSAGPFVDGTLTGITLMTYETNGR